MNISRTIAGLAGLALSMALGACGVTFEDDEATTIAQGRAFAETNCARCHAIAEAGDSPYPAAPPFRTLSDRYPLEHLSEALAEGIGVTHGGAVEMPEFVLAPDEIDALLAYLASIQN